jgi:hypothetical protein
VAGNKVLHFRRVRLSSRGVRPRGEQLLIEALGVFEFIKAARTNLDRNNWDYLIGGSETETTFLVGSVMMNSEGRGGLPRGDFPWG